MQPPGLRLQGDAGRGRVPSRLGLGKYPQVPTVCKMCGGGGSIPELPAQKPARPAGCRASPFARSGQSFVVTPPPPCVLGSLRAGGRGRAGQLEPPPPCAPGREGIGPPHPVSGPNACRLKPAVPRLGPETRASTLLSCH